MEIDFIIQAYFIGLVLAIYGVSIWLQILYLDSILKKDYSLKPSVSVIMSAFNEGEHVFRTIDSVFEAEYDGDLRVLVTDDCSKDDTWEWIQKAKEAHPRLQIFKNEKNKGKALSLLGLVAHVETEFIIAVDSDCVFAKNAIAELMASYTNEKIGAVGGAVFVKNPDKSWITRLQNLQYNRIFQISKMSETFFGGMRCISGALFSVKTSVYKEIAPQIEARTWAGKPVHDSQDSFMTTLIVMSGHDTLFDPKAKVWTDVPETFSHYFSQQTRWRRGDIRMFLWSLKPKNFLRLLHTRPPISFLRIFIFNICIIMWPPFLIWAIIVNGSPNLIVLNPSLFAFTLFIGIISLLLARLKGDRVEVPILTLLILPLWMSVNLFFLTVLAAFTLSAGSWETRS